MNIHEKNKNTVTQLVIRNLHVSVEDKEILHGIDLSVRTGEIHAIMGPNGSGKSTLSQVLFGHPKYTVTQGTIELNGQNITSLSTDKRAHLGLFLAFQSPNAVPGVKISSFLKQAINAKRRSEQPKYAGMKIREYREMLEQAMDTLRMKREFADRYLNDGLSGGEKKKSEILQMALLQPNIAILDEIDSGLDVDALKLVAHDIDRLYTENGMAALIITHYPRILKYVKPDMVHVLIDGIIVRSGNAALAHEIEERGYDWLRTNATAKQPA